MYGPTNPVSEQEHISKYRLAGESFLDLCNRISGALCDNEQHRRDFRMTLLQQNFMPAGRIQRAVGSPLRVTPYNCFVSGTIEDDSSSIMDMAKEAFMTMRTGGGIGYDFSTLRPRGSRIKSFQSEASGAVSFMHIFDATCKTVRSAGGRRGAQMGVLRVDHPDIEEFIDAKTVALSEDMSRAEYLASQAGFNAATTAQLMEIVSKVSIQNRLAAFNVSIAVTDKFMEAVKAKEPFDLVFDGQVYKTVDAEALWNKIMRATWDWAEPGVLFIDRINKSNNLWYCETIAATNPCAEQPLPPHGACLLGSFNLTSYIRTHGGQRFFDMEAFKSDIPGVVRAMDNVVDYAIYPLPAQEKEAKDKRRMGLGVTGVANALEALGLPYGTQAYIDKQSEILEVLRDECYRASIALAEEKGPFPLFQWAEYLSSEFIKTLPQDIRDGIVEHGIRNSHLLSIAPTGTISLTADNISSGIEPVFAYSQQRFIINDDGVSRRQVEISDFGVREFGVKGIRADDLTVQQHVEVLIAAQKYIDSAISKTCNVGDNVTFDEFKNVYMTAWEGGAKGCTTFRMSGKRFAVLTSLDTKEGAACYIDPDTGKKTCE